MRLAVSLPYTGRPREAADMVPEYERIGVDSVWVAELWGFDSPTLMGYLAARTERITICAGILNVFSRSPALIAQTAAGLDHVSGGRAVLGLGTSGPQVIEGWHGVPFELPLGRLRDTVDTVRRALARQPIDRSGAIPAGRGRGLGKALRMLNAPERADLPIVVASLGPAAVRFTAEAADGWLPIFFLPERATAVWADALAQGRAQRPSDLGPLQIVAGGVVGIDEDAAAARAAARQTLATYIGGMGARDTNFYFDLACRYGFRGQAERIQERFLAGHHAAAGEAVPDELIALTQLIGSTSDVRERLDAYRTAGVSELLVTPAGDDPCDQLRRLRQLM